MGKKTSVGNIRKKLEMMGEKSDFAARLIAQAEYWMLRFDKGQQRRISELIEAFAPDRKNDRRALRKLKKDMLYSRMAYHVSFSQYFIFEFERLSREGRKEYVGSKEKARYTDALHESSDLFLLFRNKYKTYERFQRFYHREMIELRGEEDRERFLAFAARHPKFILKVEDASKGEGVIVKDLAAPGSESAAAVADSILGSARAYVAEEYIRQAPELARLHPSSVNTVRFVTYLKQDRVMHLFSFLRIGSGGGVIDNATSGGIAAAIDMETGIVTSPGCREDLTRYLKHPDTGAQIIGMQLPRWDELLSMVDELARVEPQQKYVGWDLALTEDGWVMVEGNDSAMMTAIQMCERRGLRKVFDAAFKAD